MKEEERNKIIAKAWKDPEFKKRLLNDPKKAFQEVGCRFPNDTKFKVIEDTTSTFTFVLPPSPSNVKGLSEADLIVVAGGTACPSDDPCNTLDAKHQDM